MFKRLSTSYNLVSIAFRYIAKDMELLGYTLLSIVSVLLIVVGFYYIDHFYFWLVDTIISSLARQETILIEDIKNNITEIFSGTMWKVLLFTIIFVLYLISNFITLFFNGAIITSVQRRIDWKDNQFIDGLKDSFQHIRRIITWSSITSTVGILLDFIQQIFWRNSIVINIIARLIWGLWDILTFFSFPLMVLKNMWVQDAIKESSNLFKKTWWERAIVYVWVWSIFGILYFLLFLLSILICFYGFLWIWGMVFIWWILLLIILSSTSNTIINTLLLHYAYTWKLPDDMIDKINISDVIKEPK